MKEKKRSVGLIVGIIISVIVIVVGIVFAYFTINSLFADKRVPIDLNTYVSISAEGYDAMGNLTCEFDEEGFVADYKDIIEIKKRGQDVMFNMALAFAENPAEALRELCVSYEIEGNINNLSNGDVVIFKWNCDTSTADEYFGCNLIFEDIVFTVNELEEVESFDPFEYLSVDFTEDGKVELTQNYDVPEMQYISFEADKYLVVRNGEELTVNAELGYHLDADKFFEMFGKLPNPVKKTYVVEGINEYVQSASEIPQELIDASSEELIAEYRAYVDKRWDNPETLQSVEYIGNYFLKAKEPEKYGNGNSLYLIFKVTALETENNEVFDYYIYGHHANVCIHDGVVNLGEGSMMDLTYGTYEFRKGKLYYIGFETLKDFFDERIGFATQRFDFEDNIQY